MGLPDPGELAAAAAAERVLAIWRALDRERGGPGAPAVREELDRAIAGLASAAADARGPLATALALTVSAHHRWKRDRDDDAVLDAYTSALLRLGSSLRRAAR